MSGIVRNSPGFYHRRIRGVRRTHVKDYPPLSNGVYFVATNETSKKLFQQNMLWEGMRGYGQTDRKGRFYLAGANTKIYRYNSTRNAAKTDIIFNVPVIDADGGSAYFAVPGPDGSVFCVFNNYSGNFGRDGIAAYDPYGNILWVDLDGNVFDFNLERIWNAICVAKDLTTYWVGACPDPIGLMVQKRAYTTGNKVEQVYTNIIHRSLTYAGKGAVLDKENKFLYIQSNRESDTPHIAKINTFDLSLAAEYKSNYILNGVSERTIDIGPNGYLYMGGIDGNVVKIAPDFSSEELIINRSETIRSIAVDTYGSIYLLESTSGGNTRVLKYNPDKSKAFEFSEPGAPQSIAVHPGKSSILPSPSANNFKLPPITNFSADVGDGFIKASCDEINSTYFRGYRWYLDNTFYKETSFPKIKFDNLVNGQTYKISVEGIDKLGLKNDTKSIEASPVTPYKYYRLNINALVGSSEVYTGVIEFVLNSKVGGTTRPPVLGGVPSASKQDPSYPKEKAFNGILEAGEGWIATGITSFPVWIQFEFNDPVGIVEYGVSSYPASYRAGFRSAKDFQLLASNDGENWIVLDEQVGQTGWAWGEFRYFQI